MGATNSGVDALAVLADAAIVRSLRRFLAHRRVIERPVQDGWDHYSTRVPYGEQRHLEHEPVIPVVPPLSRHGDDARVRRTPPRRRR